MSRDSLEYLRNRLQAPRKRDQPTKSIIASMLKLSAYIGVLVAALLIPATTFVVMTSHSLAEGFDDLPLALREEPIPQRTRILAKDGSVLAYFYSENRQDVALAKVAPVMKDALLSIEDNRFYEHGAIDIKGTLRALVNNATGNPIQGGSSITQQLVKMILVQQASTTKEVRAATEESTSRKIRELKYALSYMKSHTRDEILQNYLNIAYFGDGAYGISAAAKHYFSVDVDKLTIPQAATLAGLVKNPVQYDPTVYPERALTRRNTVITVMGSLGKITPAQTKEALAAPLDLKVTNFANGCVTSYAAFYCDYVRRYLMQDEDLGATLEERRNKIDSGGLTIKTYLNPRNQKAANNAVKSVGAKQKAIGAIAEVEPGTGKVRALAQSRSMGTDKKKGQTFINYTVPKTYGDSNGFQAGSTFKMFTVAAALKSGIDSGKVYKSPQQITMPSGSYTDCYGDGTGEWKPKNSTGAGTMGMYQATRQSVNTYFAQLEEDAGLCNTVQAARSMGIYVPDGHNNKAADGSRGPTNVVPSFTLGVTDVSPLDMAAAYATPASGGTYCTPRPVASVADSRGKVIKKYAPTCKKVLTDDEAATINAILRGVQLPGGFGYGNGTNLTVPSAAKTGTTSDNTAVWFAGYTPQLATAAMIAGANAKGQPRSIVNTTIAGRFVTFQVASGSGLAGPMWKKAMGPIQKYLDNVPFANAPAPREDPMMRELREKREAEKKAKEEEEAQKPDAPAPGQPQQPGNPKP
ncbi:transglycosylase domain-containing protein [soil metagenome]